jgi:hypothetical protein
MTVWMLILLHLKVIGISLPLNISLDECIRMAKDQNQWFEAEMRNPDSKAAFIESFPGINPDGMQMRCVMQREMPQLDEVVT